MIAKKKVNIAQFTENFFLNSLDGATKIAPNIGREFLSVGIQYERLSLAKIMIELTAASMAIGIQPVKNLGSHELYSVACGRLLEIIDKHEIPDSKLLKDRFLEYLIIWERANPKLGNMPWDDVSIRFCQNLDKANSKTLGPVSIMVVSNKLVSLAENFPWKQNLTDFDVHV